MKKNTALAVFSAAACLAVWGCMSVNAPDRDRDAHANSLNFVNQSVNALVKAAVVQQQPGQGGDEDLSERFEAIGCPKLAALFKDIGQYDPSKPTPASLTGALECFGISGDKIDTTAIHEKLADPQALLACLCGGDALSQFFDAVKWHQFSVGTAAAAGAAFNAQGSAGGKTFGVSGSASAGTGFNASGAGAAGSAYSNP